MPTPTIFLAEDTYNDLTFGIDAGGVTGRWIAAHYPDESSALAAAVLVSPTVYLGFIRENFNIERLGGPHYKAHIRYGIKGLGGGGVPAGAGAPPTPTAPGGGGSGGQDVPLLGGYSFDTTGRTVRLFSSFETLSTTGRDGIDVSGLDFARAINVQGDRVEGVEVPAPSLRWTRTVARAVVDMAYVRTCKTLTGRQNNAPFYGYPTGSVTYLGAVGQQTAAEGYWTVVHHFETEENQTDVEVCEGLIVPTKNGADYLWVYFEEELSGNFVIPKPVLASVEQVLKPGAFGGLEIGV